MIVNISNEHSSLCFGFCECGWETSAYDHATVDQAVDRHLRLDHSPPLPVPDDARSIDDRESNEGAPVLSEGDPASCDE